MKPIPLNDALSKQLAELLPICGPFYDYDELQSLFIDQRISLWRNQLPRANNVAGQVSQTVALLWDRHNSDNENGLVLLLQVLLDRIDPNDLSHQQLQDLIARLLNFWRSLVEQATQQEAYDTMSLDELMMQAEDAAQRKDYDTAEACYNRVIAVGPTSFYADDARYVLDKIKVEREYQYIKQLLDRDAKRAHRLWEKFQQKHPNHDPEGLGSQFGPPKVVMPAQASPTVSQKDELLLQCYDDPDLHHAVYAQLDGAVNYVELQRFVQFVKTQNSHRARRAVISKPTAADLLPAPFDWSKIPHGAVKVEGFAEPFTVEPFLIAKYPLTNAQYDLFVEAGGYNEQKWWTEAGWAQRTEEGWRKPRYWDNTKWNRSDRPVVGVSWYEAVAYCNWLSVQTGQEIRLPTEAQWQFAAQGTDGREYPWGNEWDGIKCNNNVNSEEANEIVFFKPDSENKPNLPAGHGQHTTSVTAYEGRGDSPFGVVDMAGNVWEWCMNEYHSELNEENAITVRVLRGRSWNGSDPENFRADFRFKGYPDYRLDVFGFRLSCSL